MATQAAALKYASYGAGTATAGGYYDTSPRKVAVPAAPAPAAPAAIPVGRPAVRTAAKPKHAYGISLFAIFGSAFVAALLLFVVLARISYIEVTDESVQLEARLDELTQEGKLLEISYEQAFDMDAVEQYATGVLGMVRPDVESLTLVDTTPRDRAVILIEESEESGGGLGSFLSSLLAYLK